ncbi:putative ribonuclease H-like domain-containing protein [Tanacetum coccineum]
MQEELVQFQLQNVWTLVDLLNGKRAIGTMLVYRNKKDERGVVVRNKARLVAQGHTLEEGIDYDEVFALSAFLYGTIEKKVYVCQPLRFEYPQFPDKVYKVEKSLYGLHQAHRAWYETLSTYLLENRYKRGTIDKTLFIKKGKHDILLVQVYVDDIIFGSTKKTWCIKFELMMHKRFQMSFMGELTFFLGLQVKQKSDGIFISQDKYVAEILKKFDFSSVKTASTLMEPNKALVKDSEAEDVDVHLYRSMIGSLMYLTASRPDIMFDVCACARFQVTPKISHLHAVKRIFRDSYEKRLIEVLKIHTDHNVADILTKGFDVSSFNFLIASIGGRPRLMLISKDLMLLQVNAVRHNLMLMEVNAVRHPLTTIVVSEATIRRLLKFNDEGRMDCLHNATIFEEIARMGYEKMSQKLTFYKAFLCPQWKFLIPTFLYCLSATTTA